MNRSMKTIQDPGSIPGNRVFREIKVWVKQLFLLCLMGILVAIVRWSETGLWITTLTLLVILAVVLLLRILRALEFLEKETEEHENHNTDHCAGR